MKIEKLYELFIKVREVSTDTRVIRKNSIFFALKGDNFNGNRFAGDAIAKGASYVVVDEKIDCKDSEKIILVEDVLQTLQELSAFHRKKLQTVIIAITGSNGKTTTKELITSVLSTKYRVFSTQGNLNNHIGVPLTLLNIDESFDFGVVEMGANHQGEIAELCTIADPDFGLITNIGRAHLEGFGSFQKIIETKGELYSYLMNKGGTIFLNSADPTLSLMAGNYGQIVRYGHVSGGIFGEVTAMSPFLRANISLKGEKLDVESHLTGRYNLENMVTAAAVGNYFSIPPNLINRGISQYEPKSNRSQLLTKGKLTIVMDAYNANPSSMAVSIDSFIEADLNTPKYIILGDMYELGSVADEEHEQIVKKLAGFHDIKVWLTGPLFTKAARGYGVSAFPDVTDFMEYLENNPIKNGSLLMKGSRKMELEKILKLF